MKAITLWQPWASLLAVGPKKYETRSWKTKHRGWIAIHAAATFNRLVTDAYQRFEKELREIVLLATPKNSSATWAIPRGAVVAVAKLIHCGETSRSSDFIPDLAAVLPYGDYSPGRWIWVFSEIVPVEPAIPAIGRQGLWNWDAPGRIQILIGNQLDNL